MYDYEHFVRKINGIVVNERHNGFGGIDLDLMRISSNTDHHDEMVEYIKNHEGWFNITYWKTHVNSVGQLGYNENGVHNEPTFVSFSWNLL